MTIFLYTTKLAWVQLDIRTKMCLRDSLYRLAKSAGQRHAYGNTNGSVGDDVEACKAMAQDPSR